MSGATLLKSQYFPAGGLFLCCPYKLGQSSMYKGLDISCAGWNPVFINLTRLVCQECRDTFPFGCSLSSSSRVDIGNAEGMNYPNARCFDSTPWSMWRDSAGWSTRGRITENTMRTFTRTATKSGSWDKLKFAHKQRAVS